MRIAMWSGPRNLSTAMMYAFAARPDFSVMDEPFYGPYLIKTGVDHPMREEVLANHETDTDRVQQACLGPIPDGKRHLYMKHMTHHIVDGIPLDWASECVNVHLIRHPARVIASYLQKRAEVTPDDLGYHRHAEIFARFPGPVVDSDDVQADPAGSLERLCAEIGLPYDPAMLSWPAGPKPFDGAWAPHWYNAVHQSTGLVPSAPDPLPQVEGHDVLLNGCTEIFAEMAQRKL